MSWIRFYSMVRLITCGCFFSNLFEGQGDQITAASSQPGYAAEGGHNGNRFSLDPGQAWRGGSGQSKWWWQIEFTPPRDLGAILQIQSSHPFVCTNAPSSYVWQTSNDGSQWSDLEETRVPIERRIFRLHRLSRSLRCRYLRLSIGAVSGSYPVLREAEFFSRPRAKVSFPNWAIVVNTTEDRRLPGTGQEFIPLAKACAGWEQLQAQQIWLGDFDPSFLEAEPRPMCGFLSGNFKDWCEVDRQLWRGAQEVLRNKTLPLWASCGGAQGLAIISEYGVDHPWDCPHCRDPLHPKTPMYTHIGHTGKRPCGDYSACIFERGSVAVRQLTSDPVFAGLPAEFRAMESHCGQIEWPPKGWRLIAVGGSDAKTKTQCLRLRHRYIYAAQFHIEMDGAPETSRQIMANFLDLASRVWRE